MPFYRSFLLPNASSAFQSAILAQSQNVIMREYQQFSRITRWEARNGTSGLPLSALLRMVRLRTYFSFEVTIDESNGDGTLSYTSTAHNDEVVRAGSARIVIFRSAVTAEIVVVWVLVSALGTLRHRGSALYVSGRADQYEM